MTSANGVSTAKLLKMLEIAGHPGTPESEALNALRVARNIVHDADKTFVTIEPTRRELSDGIPH